MFDMFNTMIVEFYVPDVDLFGLLVTGMSPMELSTTISGDHPALGAA